MAELIKELWAAEGRFGYHVSLFQGYASCGMTCDRIRRFVPEPAWTLYDHQEPVPPGKYLVEMQNGTVKLMAASAG